MAQSLPSVEFPICFCLCYNLKHWSNEEETIRLLVEVIVKKELDLPIEQKSLYTMECFQSTVNKQGTSGARAFEYCSCDGTKEHDPPTTA